MPGAESAGGVPGQRTLVLFSLIRMAVGLLLVAIVPFVDDLPRPLPALDPKTMMALGLGSFAVWSIAAALAPRLGRHRAFVWVQLVLDALLATLLVQYTSGPRSALFVLYVANISAAGILVSPNAALVVSALDSVLFLASSMALDALLPSRLWQITGSELAYELVLRCFALLLIGLLVRLPNERVRQVRAEQSAVLDELKAGVLRVDEAGRVTQLNPAARELLGLREGDRMRDALSPLDDRWEQTIRVGEEVRHLVCSRGPVDVGGEVVLVEDVTRFKQMEANLEREERLAAVGRLTAALAHEIRNPLTSLSGAAQLLAEERPDPLHDILLREARRINGLVEELLDQARPMSVVRIPSDPGAIIEDVIASVRVDPRFRGRIDVQMICDELPRVQLDPGRFKQVLWNLMLNALQAIPDRGNVTVRATVHEEDLLVRVEDTGVGISPETQRRLFDPFFTTRTGGTGLGLATVHRIVAAHGGEISVESEVGAGAAFILRFPRAVTMEGGRLAG